MFFCFLSHRQGTFPSNQNNNNNNSNNNKKVIRVPNPMVLSLEINVNSSILTHWASSISEKEGTWIRVLEFKIYEYLNFYLILGPKDFIYVIQ